MKWYYALALCLGLAACGGGSNQAPRNLDNACSILEQRPGYLRAFRATERKWGVPVSVQMATIYQESKFVSRARPPRRYKLGVIPMGRQSSRWAIRRRWMAHGRTIVVRLAASAHGGPTFATRLILWDGT